MWRLYLAALGGGVHQRPLQLFQVLFARPARNNTSRDARESVHTLNGTVHAISCDVPIVGGGHGADRRWKLRRAGRRLSGCSDRELFPRRLKLWRRLDHAPRWCAI